MRSYFPNNRNKKIRFAIFLFGIWFGLAAYAAEIYRWVDENGRTHFSDKPPQQTKRPVARIDSQQFEISPEQRQSAEAHAAAEKARLADIANRKEPEAPISSLPAPKASSTGFKPAATECATLLQRFKDHSECMAPFMNVGGSFKPNAFETCGPAVPYPAKECS